MIRLQPLHEFRTLEQVRRRLDLANRCLWALYGDTWRRAGYFPPREVRRGR